MGIFDFLKNIFLPTEKTVKKTKKKRASKVSYKKKHKNRTQAKNQTFAKRISKIKTSSLLSQLAVKKRYAVLQLLNLVSVSGGFSDKKNNAVHDAASELDIDLNDYNNAKIDGSTACDLLQNLNQNQKDEFSRLIILVVGADGSFIFEEMIWVNDLIKEIGLDDNILTELEKLR